MTESSVRLEESWKQQLADQFQESYMRDLKAFLAHELRLGKTIYPKGSEYFQALNSTPFSKVTVVILGQDPYHGPGQAHGLSFSVAPGIAVPPSLMNIYKELRSDLGIDPPRHGYLGHWAAQGVLLLNAVLTVEQGRAASHQNKGWEKFTDHIIRRLNDERENLVFMLWGSHAQAKGKAIDRTRHLVLEAPHPSPLSAHRGFFGCRHFSRANNYLSLHGKPVIDWQLPEILH